MKRNDELDTLFKNFINDLMLLVKESKATSVNKNEDIYKNYFEINKKLSNQKKSLNDQLKNGADFIEFNDNPLRLIKKNNDLDRIKKISHNTLNKCCLSSFSFSINNIIAIFPFVNKLRY